MSIELHCSSCSGKVSAPDHAGGRRGKCPYCGASVYIPMPPDPNEEIGVEPLDEEFVQHVNEMIEESFAVTAGAGADFGMDDGPGEVLDCDEEVKLYILSLRDSRLDKAESALDRMKKQKTKAKNHVQAMIADPMQQPYDGVPAPLMKAFLQKLATELQ